MDLATLTSALGRFGTGLSQHARLITLTSAHDVTLPDAPLAERVRGREAVNELYRFDVDALSTSTDLDLAGFIGEELTATLLQPDGTRRAWHGICTAAEWLGADGGVARYRLRLEPALALLRLRRDSYIFQNKNVEGIVSELFADYPQLRFEFDVTQDMPARAICTQYRESDYDFFVRLLASEGLSWRFEHDQGDIADDGQARHRLVIFDGAAAFPDTRDNPVVRFHGVRATDSDDAIDALRARRRVQANAVSISSWAPGQVLAPAAEQQSYLDAGELPFAQVYDGAGERIATDSGAAEQHSRLMLQALELDNKLFEGEGAVRRLAAGHAFALTQHDRYPAGENMFKVLWVEHEARNNVGAQIATADAGGVEPGTYRNRFGCVRAAVPVVPQATARPNPHTALGPQTALVVGLPDSVATTTRDHQVRVQFAWQRGAGGNPGSPYHDTDADGCAPGDDRSGTWVRVAEALAGPNWGSQFTPRVGTEVLVDFIDNDIDRPLVVAQLYTGADAPPFAAGVDSGVNHAGTISGIHTQTFDGAGWNQWQLDDTPGQLRMRLATSLAATQLNLGYLVHQPARSALRGAYRGSGFELRTNAWAVVRGGDGVLLTTSTRAAQGASVTSTQMDAAEAVGTLKAAQSLDKALRDSATAQQACSSQAAAQAQQDFLAQIDPAAKGKFDGAVNGQDASQAKPGSREIDAGKPVERFARPLVLMDAQASVNWATPASTVLFAGQQLHWTTQSDMHMTAAHTLSSVSAEATALYTHGGGIQAFAANGPVSMQAHTDRLEILADKEVTIISVNDSIEIKASKKIVLQAGQASVTLEGGDITFACPGTFSVKGAQHPFDGGARAAATSAALPGQLIGAAAGSLISALGKNLPSPSSSAQERKFASMDERVDVVMADALNNGERLASNTLPNTRSNSTLEKLHTEEMARITSQAREEKLTWDPNVGGYRDADGTLHVEIAGVNEQAKKSDDLIEAAGGLAIETPLAILSGTAAAVISPLYGVYKDVASGKFGTSEGIQIGEKAASQLAERMTFKPQTATAQYVLGKTADFVSTTGIQGLGFSELSALSSAASTAPFVADAMREINFVGSGSGFKNPARQIGAINPNGLKPRGATQLATPASEALAPDDLFAGATRRLATAGDQQFPTANEALAEALTRHRIDPSTVEITQMYGKNPNLLGPRGKPWETIRGLNLDGDLIEFEHHANGHFFGDTNEFELPHYHGPNGEHLTY